MKIQEKNKKAPGSPYFYALNETIYTCMTLIYLAFLNNKKTFDEIWQTIAENFGLSVIDLKNFKSTLESESKFFRKFSKKILKKYVYLKT